jgi:hypothetical protein
LAITDGDAGLPKKHKGCALVTLDANGAYDPVVTPIQFVSLDAAFAYVRSCERIYGPLPSKANEVRSTDGHGLTEAELVAYGEQLATIFLLKRDREHKDRWLLDLGWGSKTARGLAASVLEMATRMEKRGAL